MGFLDKLKDAAKDKFADTASGMLSKSGLDIDLTNMIPKSESRIAAEKQQDEIAKQNAKKSCSICKYFSSQPVYQSPYLSQWRDENQAQFKRRSDQEIAEAQSKFESAIGFCSKEKKNLQSYSPVCNGIYDKKTGKYLYGGYFEPLPDAKCKKCRWLDVNNYCWSKEQSITNTEDFCEDIRFSPDDIKQKCISCSYFEKDKEVNCGYRQKSMPPSATCSNWEAK